MAHPAGGSPLRIGVLAPLGPPGWTEAGRHLLAGCELAARDVNASGGVAGSALELIVRDTAADPQRAAAAVEELADLDVAAVAGEYHSVAALGAAAQAERLGVPFLCSSAVLDALTDEPASWVARLAPTQSHGWRIYADFLQRSGHDRIAVAAQASVYWAAGARILREHVDPRGGTVVDVELAASDPATRVCDALVESGAGALLLLVNQPHPAWSIVEAVRGDERLAGVLIGAPAGQPELPGWETALDRLGAGVPFLRYTPEQPNALGARVAALLGEQLGKSPSFVALEGYDAIITLAEAIRLRGPRRSDIAEAWPHVALDGTRGTIRFDRAADTGVWQWTWPPVQVVDRDPDDPSRFRVLHTG